MQNGKTYNKNINLYVWRIFSVTIVLYNNISISCPLHILVSAKEYQIIEFINDKKTDVISIDCVLSKWVTYDEKLHSCISKFMPPPYNKKTKAKLYSFITAKYDAPEDWPCYPVYLRGDAGKYAHYCAKNFFICFLLM